jgi:3'-phosphoadenosine 5'-phosphosulfate sulfotransferase (PAPS reductase)/FAD synthetase
MRKKHSKIVLLSGGFDSAVCLYKNLDCDKIVFFNYNQLYFDNEYEKLNNFINHLNLKNKLHVVRFDLNTDARFRNFFFILYTIFMFNCDEIVIGSRNLLPLFDNYKDSNWLSLKIFGFLTRTKISCPITGWTKKMILNYLKSKNYLDFYNCYFNANDINKCECKNCKEMRLLL